MRNVDAFIDNANDYVPAALRNVPGLRRSDKIQTVELIRIEVIRNQFSVKQIIWYSIEHIIARIERGDSFERVIRGHARNAEAANQVRALEAINLNGNGLHILGLQGEGHGIVLRYVKDGLSF